MRWEDLVHVVNAAANVTAEADFIIVGSQAILGSHPDAPPELLRSMEADLYPAAAPELADEIDGALGDGSQFHRTFGYYAHGVGPETAVAPEGWHDRLIRVEIPARQGAGVQPVGLFLEPHDLVLAKCVAGRERDWDFARDALRAGVVALPLLLERVERLPVDDTRRRHIRAMLEGFGVRPPH